MKKKKLIAEGPKNETGQYFTTARCMCVFSPSRLKIQAWHKCQLQGRKDSVFVGVIAMHPS